MLRKPCNKRFLIIPSSLEFKKPRGRKIIHHEERMSFLQMSYSKGTV